MNFLDDRTREDYFVDITDTLDDYIAASSHPQKEYASIIIPFFLDCMNHIHSELSHEQKGFLADIQSNWNTDGISDLNSLKDLRNRIVEYCSTLPISDLKHRYLCACLEMLTGQWIDEESITWLFISGLLRSKIPLDSWLSNEMKTRFSRIIKKKKNKSAN